MFRFITAASCHQYQKGMLNGCHQQNAVLQSYVYDFTQLCSVNGKQLQAQSLAGHHRVTHTVLVNTSRFTFT